MRAVYELYGATRSSAPHWLCFLRWLQDLSRQPRAAALTAEDALHPRGAVQPGRIEPIITLIIYFSPSTAEPARKRSLIPFAFQSCNIYSKPELLTVNILSEEQSWL